MTKIVKPVTRETDCYERADALIVTLHPKRLSIRLKGHREAVHIDYLSVLDLARKRGWQQQRTG